MPVLLIAGKRAAGLCKDLGLCDLDAIAATSADGCTFSSFNMSAGTSTATAGPASMASAAATISASTLDYCSPEGLYSGTVLPGIAPSATYLPPGTCDTTADCRVEGNECNRADERPLCSCIGGQDYCRKIGGCKEVRVPCS